MTLTGQAIKDMRIMRGLTQDRLAMKAGIAREHLSQLERGLFLPNPITVSRIVKGLNTSAESLLSIVRAEMIEREAKRVGAEYSYL